MNTQTLYQDESVLYQLNPLVPCVEFKPKGLPKSTEHLKQAYHMLVNLCNELVPRQNGLGVMIDIRETDGITSQDLEWVTAEIIPRFIAMGVKKLAVVDGVTELAHITSEEFLELAVRSPIQHQLFKGPENARQWLQLK
jgi:hypothetical protein